MKHADNWNFRVRAVAGYILLGLLCLLMGIGLFVRMRKFLDSENTQKSQLIDRALIMGNTLSLLFENEWMGNNYVQSPGPENRQTYLNSFQEIRVALDSLHRHAAIPEQKRQILHIRRLLMERSANIDSLVVYQDRLAQIPLKAQRQINAALPKNLPERLPLVKDTIRIAPIVPTPPPITKQREEIIFDTIKTVQPARKRSVWGRINQAVTGESPRPDSIIEVRRTRRVYTDTLFNLPPPTGPVIRQEVSEKASRDSVLRVVQQIIDRHQARSNKEYQAVALVIDSLSVLGQKIDQAVNAEMQALQASWFTTSVQDIALRHDSLRRSERSVLLAGLVALLIVIFFSVLIIGDINKSSRYQRQVEASRQQAETLMKSREKLLLTISHDIKVPLSSIMGYLDLLKQPGTGRGSQAIPAYLESMTYSAEHIMELLTNLLEYYRLEAGKTRLNPAFTPITHLFEECTAVFAPITQKKNVALRLETSMPQDQGLITDALHLRQIVMNLLSNAVKFTDSGHITLQARLKGAKLCFSVYDTGCGISADKQKSIFDEFARIETPSTPRKEGVGFGLSIVKRLVNLFEGQLSVETNADQGCTFTVCIPVTLTEEKYVAPQKLPEACPSTPEDPPVLRVLVVDDDPSQVHLTAEILHRAGHLTFMAETLNAAWDILTQHPLDLVITDIQLVEATGLDLLARIRQSSELRQLPAIAATANAQYSGDYFLEAGFDGYLAKPYTMPRLLEAIHKISEKIPAPAFNVRSVLEMTEGDAEAFAQIKRIFTETTRANLQSLSAALEAEDWARLRQLAHKMLPMCRQFRLEAASDLFFMEQADLSSPETVAPFRDAATRLLAHLPSVMDALETWY